MPSYSALTLGLVRWRRGRLTVGPVTLVRLGDPTPRRHGWAWPIEGGALVAEPGGFIGVGSEPGRTFGWLEGYRPRLPWPVYRFTQLPLHRLLTRVYLLRQRGRTPPPGVPAAPSARLAAAALDLGVCAALTTVVVRRRRLATFLPLTLAYHLAFWSLGGQTPGARMLGLRLASVDGSPVSPGQGVLRLLGLARAARELRAAHDDFAATDVVERRP